MDKHSENTLRKIEQNDAALTNVLIGRSCWYDNSFNSSDSEDYSRLGAAIGYNTHLTKLSVANFNGSALTVTNSEFFDGLKQNASIHKLELDCNNHNIVGGVDHEIFKAYQENNSHLTSIYITRARLQNGGDDIVATTLRRCTNLTYVDLNENDMTDTQLFVDAISRHNKLEEFDLDGNNIGNTGCEILATLLEDSSCNLRKVSLTHNQIGDAGATAIANSLSKNVKLQEISLRSNQIGDAGATAIANSLSGNNKLQKLCLHGNSINHIGDIFCGVLCNTSSINSTYSSNHTLNVLIDEDYYLNDEDYEESLGRHLTSLLKMNKDANKSHVAMKKILKYHSNIDMEPLFEWDAEDGEHNLKALPHIISWFDRAKVAVAANAEDDDEDDGDSSDSDDEEESSNIDGRKLSAIYQFAMAMPTLFVPASHNEGGNKNSKKKQKLL